MAEPGSGEYGGMSEARRNAIVEALLAQAYQQQAPAAFMGEAVAGDPYQDTAPPSDPDTGYATAADIAGPVVASPGDMTGPSPAGLAAIAANAQSSNLNSDNIGGNLASPSPGLTAAMAAPVGTPAGFYAGLPGFTSPDNAAPAPSQQTANLGDQLGYAPANLGDQPGYNMAPAFNAFEGAPQAQQAFDQGLTLGGLNIAGYNVAPAFNAFEGAPITGAPITSDEGVTGPVAGPVTGPIAAANPAGYLAGLVTEGDVASGTPASTAVSVGYGVGLGLGDAVGGGFGGATGDGTSGSTAAGDAAGTGVGIGGAATGISGGPGGTGEGGANTGEGGVGSGPGGGGGGGDGGK